MTSLVIMLMNLALGSIGYFPLFSDFQVHVRDAFQEKNLQLTKLAASTDPTNTHTRPDKNKNQHL